jgi:GT2 family glycosyltransferase
MKLYIVLLNWNGWQDTIACLDSLLASSYKDFTVVVCDNGSTDQSVTRLVAWGELLGADRFLDLAIGDRLPCPSIGSAPSVVLLKNLQNLGFAGGCNTGISLAMQDPECAYVWLLNNDTEVDPAAVEAVLKYMDSRLDVGICGSTLIYHADRSLVQAYGGSSYSRWMGRSRHLGAFSHADHLPDLNDVPAIEAGTSYVVGAAMMLRRDLFEKIGLLYEGYFLYYEELDFACRAKGFCKIGYACESIVYHKEGASIGTSASGGSPLSLYYLFRNRVRFTWRFYPVCLPTVFLYACWELIKFALKGRGEKLRAGFYGLLQLPFPRSTG